MPQSFDDFHLRPESRQALTDVGYETPTEIQSEAIPILLEGGDLIGVAATGTGKTLAFLLPIFEKLDLSGDGPQALIICPTRELAIQVAGEADRFGTHLGVRTVLAYGGTSSAQQKHALAAGCELVVGTPGRLLDFVTSAWLSLRKLRTLVLDEADRMLDMGFINDVDAILRRTPLSRQTLLFSATFPDEIRRLSERYMFHPSMVRTHEGTRVTPNVDHAFYPVRGDQKEALLLAILRQKKPAKVLIFTATREATSEVALVLRRRRHDVVSLSSLLSQANRERALQAFRTGECPILVATDVAARGLDITDIDLVVNFDVPGQAEDYVHRIGRTGRAERTGSAVTLVAEDDERRAGDIDRMLGEKVPRLEVEGFDYKPRERPRDRPGRGGARGPGGRRRGASRPSGDRRGSGGGGRRKAGNKRSGARKGRS